MYLATRFVYYIFTVHFWFNDCLDEFKPVYYERYVDDLFVLFDLLSTLKNLMNI